MTNMTATSSPDSPLRSSRGFTTHPQVEVVAVDPPGTSRRSLVPTQTFPAAGHDAPMQCRNHSASVSPRVRRYLLDGQPDRQPIRVWLGELWRSVCHSSYGRCFDVLAHSGNHLVNNQSEGGSDTASQFSYLLVIEQLRPWWGWVNHSTPRSRFYRRLEPRAVLDFPPSEVHDLLHRTRSVPLSGYWEVVRRTELREDHGRIVEARESGVHVDDRVSTHQPDFEAGAGGDQSESSTRLFAHAIGVDRTRGGVTRLRCHGLGSHQRHGKHDYTTWDREQAGPGWRAAGFGHRRTARTGATANGWYPQHARVDRDDRGAHRTDRAPREGSEATGTEGLQAPRDRTDDRHQLHARARTNPQWRTWCHSTRDGVVHSSCQGVGPIPRAGSHPRSGAPTLTTTWQGR